MLTPDQQRYYQTYVNELLVRFRMLDWDIAVIREPASADNHAEIMIVKGQKRADMALGRLFPYENAETQRHFIVHELVHALIREIPDTIEIIKKPLGTIMFGVFKQAHLHAEENVTDVLAGLMAQMVPLPKKMKWAASKV